MGRGTLLSRKYRLGGSAHNGGWSLIELTVTLFLLMAIALFGMKTMVAATLMQNWSIGQSMTDAYAGIETANAQRYVFSDIESGGSAGVKHWGIYPNAIASATPEVMGYLPSPLTPPTAATAAKVTATVLRTYHRYPTTPGTVDPVTGAVSYLLESYVVYQNGPRKYCKVSKVYRDQ